MPFCPRRIGAAKPSCRLLNEQLLGYAKENGQTPLYLDHRLGADAPKG